AVAAEELERVAGGADRAARGADLRQRHEDAAQTAPFVVGRGRARRRRAFERERQSRLELHQEINQGLAYERVLVDAAAPLLAACGVDRGFEEAATMDAEAHQRHPEAAAADH